MSRKVACVVRVATVVFSAVVAGTALAAPPPEPVPYDATEQIHAGTNRAVVEQVLGSPQSKAGPSCARVKPGDECWSYSVNHDTWKRFTISLLGGSVIDVAWDRPEEEPAPVRAETSSGIGSIGLLGVKVGDDFHSAGKGLRGCRAADITGTKRTTCKSPSAVGGLKFSALTYESRGGTRVDRVTLTGTKPRSCSDAIAAFVATLGAGWTVQPFRDLGDSGQEMRAAIEGDMRLRVLCSKYVGFSLSVEDEWLSLPVGDWLAPPGMPQPAPELPLVQVAALARSGISLSPRGVGEVVWAVVENYGNGAKTMKVPKARWPDLASRYAWQEVESALATARRSESGLSARSAQAFEEYAVTVTSDGWFANECMRSWAAKRQ